MTRTRLQTIEHIWVKNMQWKEFRLPEVNNKEDIILIGSKNIASQRATYCTVTHSDLLEVVPFFIHDALVS